MEQTVFPNKRYVKTNLEELEQATNGLSKGQLQKVYEAQIAGQEFEQISGNMDKDYMLNEHEKFVFHVKITVPRFDPVSGEDHSLTKIDKFNPNMWTQIQKTGALDGKIVKILHDPSRVVMKNEDGKFMPKPTAKIL